MNRSRITIVAGPCIPLMTACSSQPADEPDASICLQSREKQ